MKICIPIKEKSLSAVLKNLKKAQKSADFIEIWLDQIPMDKVAELIKRATAGRGTKVKKPVIAVCRAAGEKGSFKGNEAARIAMLTAAVEAGAEFVDVGIHTDPKLIGLLKIALRKKKAQLIISHHFWNNTPELQVLEKTLEHATKLGADIIKIATTIKHFSDNVILFELTQRAVAAGKKVIVVGMGPRSELSRIGCPLLGSMLTYVALDEKSKTASGQLTLTKARAYMREGF